MTYERILIGEFSRYQELVHTERYRYAQQFVRGKTVLDIACGTGYGCAILRSAGAARVCGVDISREAIDHASAHHADPGIAFQVGNAEDLSGLGNESFDVVTSFETIEHLPNVDRYLNEIRRVLRPGGTFLVSTPDRRLASTMYPLRGKPNNPFHLREYTRKEFLSALQKDFRVVECLGQTYVPAVLVFWPFQVGFKAACYALRSLGAYRLIDRTYHNEGATAVEPAQCHRGSVATYWIVRTERA